LNFPPNEIPVCSIRLLPFQHAEIFALEKLDLTVVCLRGATQGRLRRLRLQIAVGRRRAQCVRNPNVVEIELDAPLGRLGLKYFSTARA
jgi:hypothetical protein